MSKYPKNIRDHILNHQGHWMGPRVQQLVGIKNDNKTTLYAFYDLEKSPSSFDIIPFLALAEDYRVKETKCNTIHVIIVPGSNHGFRSVSNPHNTDNWDLENKRWRLRNLLPDCCWLLPSCKAVSVLETRKEAELIYKNAAHVFPEINYTIGTPIERYNWINIFKRAIIKGVIDLPLKAPEMAKIHVKRWLDFIAPNKKIVTLNLRETIETPRNSSIESWAAFYHLINNKEYQPIFVRDAENNLSSLPLELKNTIIFPEANHVEYRSALYELSYLNMFVSNGTAAMAWFNPNVNYITFKLLSKIPEYTSCSIEFFALQGFAVGEQPEFVKKNQKWIWNYEDNLESLVNGFHSMKDIIDG